MKAILITIAAVTAALAAAPAGAQPSTLADGYSTAVPYADLNLNNPVGAKVLERRIAAQSRLVCGNRAARDVMNQWEKIDGCHDRFISSAKEQIQEALRANAS